MSEPHSARVSALDKNYVLAAASNDNRARAVVQVYNGSAIQKWKLVTTDGVLFH